MNKREVKWSQRHLGCDEYESTHYDGDFKIVVSDQDGDNYYWKLFKRNGEKVVEVASGHLPEMCEMVADLEDLAKELGLVALAAFKRSRPSPRR